MVTVRHKKNKSITRQMTVASAKSNSRLWEVIDSQSVPTAEVKKKDVEPVAEKPKAKLPETGNSFVSDTNDDLAQSTEFVKISEPTEKETLQSEYEKLSGKKPDGRWNEGKLKEKIAELNSNDDAAN